MALTTTILSRNVVGNQRLNVVTLAFDASYPTGGEAVTADALGLRSEIDALVPAGASPYGGTAYIAQYASPYVKLISLNDGTEAADTSDFSAFTINVIAIGR